MLNVTVIVRLQQARKVDEMAPINTLKIDDDSYLWTARPVFFLPRLQQDFPKRFPESQRKRYRYCVPDLALLLSIAGEG